MIFIVDDSDIDLAIQTYDHKSLIKQTLRHAFKREPIIKENGKNICI